MKTTSSSLVLTATSADGTKVHALDQGQGPAIIMLHPGMETAERYAKVATILARHFRVIRIIRRQYRLDLKATPSIGSPSTVAQEVEDVLAIAKKVGGPMLIYGHSSGGPIALEALVSSPSLFTGGIIYEPASVIGNAGDLHLCGDYIIKGEKVGKGLQLARAALRAGKPGRALGIFTHYIAGWPQWVTLFIGEITALIPAYRKLIPCQIDDLEAMERLGYRLNTYAHINIPLTILNGDRSTVYNKQIVNEMLLTLVNAEHVVLRGQGHTAHITASSELARIIEKFANKVFKH